jgi:myo-inositol-1(or 4)-monophosphatase
MNSLFGDVLVCINSNLSLLLQNRYEITYKDDGSPVTEADRYLEKEIKSLLDARLPDLTFIGEESFDFKWEKTSGYLAILDPIDGTENFCSGLKEWGVSLGIWHNGQHQGSLLMMPELGECLVTGDILPARQSRITGFSSSYTEAIAAGIRDAGEYRVTGCAVYNLLNVIRGSFCRFINPKGAYVWDLLPGLMLALEHGCEVLLDGQPYDGQLLDPTRKYCVDIRHRYDLHSRQRS